PWRIARDATSLRQFAQVLARISRRADPTLLDYPSDSLGYKPLREVIARNLWRTRGIKCHADQVLILTGLSQGLSLIARIHVERGDLVAVENPSYSPILHTFETEGGIQYPIEVDESGLSVEQLTNLTQKFRLVYTTPTHQYPTGAMLSL